MIASKPSSSEPQPTVVMNKTIKEQLMDMLAKAVVDYYLEEFSKKDKKDID